MFELNRLSFLNKSNLMPLRYVIVDLLIIECCLHLRLVDTFFQFYNNNCQDYQIVPLAWSIEKC